MKKKLLYLLLSIGLVAASTGCSANNNISPTPTPLPPVVSVEKAIFTVEQGTIISQKEVTGEVVPSQQDNLFFRASGYISRVPVKAGDLVKKGEVLAELQIDDLLAQLEQAKIDLQVAKDNYETEQLQRKYELQRAESDVVIAQTRVDQAQRKLELSSEASRQDAQSDLAIAEENLKIAQSWLELTQGKKDTSIEQLVQRSQLSVDRLERLVAEQQIIAPYDCIILKSNIIPGTKIDAYAIAFTIGDPADLVVRVLFDYDLADALTPETEVYLSTSKSSDSTYPIHYLPGFLPVSNKKESANANQEEKTSLNFFYFSTSDSIPGDEIPVGKPVYLRVILGKKDNVLLLPPAAIRGSDIFKYVIVLDNDQHRRVEIVTIGLKTDTQWEVVANLKPGDQVLGP